MCSICKQNPCHRRCPNYNPKEDAVAVCGECGSYILPGEKYIETLEGDIHVECARQMPLADLLKAIEVELFMA